VNHINGNAIYNLSSPFLEVIVEQLESEASTVANSIPYDYRIAQIIEEVQTGQGPSFGWAENNGEEHRLPRSFVDWMGQFDLESLIRETSVIGNYASTHIVSSYLSQEEVVIHGASMLVSWDSTRLGVSTSQPFSLCLIFEMALTISPFSRMSVLPYQIGSL
jgi:hypothetical protein